MPNITFDQVERRDAKEPQITKTQLLEPPQHTASGTGWDTPRSIYGVGDLVPNDASWGFDALDTTGTPPSDSNIPVKREPATPALDHAHNKRQYDSDDDDNQLPASKKSAGSYDAMGRRGSGTSSDDKYGRKTGVIDLTGEDSDDEQDLTMPERQFVPRAEYDSSASSFPRQKISSPPRTFTKGLEPIAAHPRKPPIVHRQKPPIKPAGRQRKTVSASPSPAIAAGQPVLNQRRRLLSTQPNDFPLVQTPTRSSSTVRTLEGTPLGCSTDRMDQTPGRELNLMNHSGPFEEDDDSSEDEAGVAAAPKEAPSRDSVTRFLNRPRNDTPVRSRQNDILEHSRAMRAQARERAQEDSATRANTVAPGAGNADVDMTDEQQAFLGLPHRRTMP